VPIDRKGLRHVRPGSRSGVFAQAALHVSDSASCRQGPFAPRPLRRFPATTTPSDSRPCGASGYGFPLAPWGTTPSTPGLSGSSTSLSVRAVPTHPGEPGGCMRLCLRHPRWLHLLWQAGHSHRSVSRPNRVRLRYGSPRPPCRAPMGRLPTPPPARLHVSQAFHMVNSSQFTREVRLSLTHQRTQRLTIWCEKEPFLCALCALCGERAVLCGLCALCGENADP
jgi:hypothetical protein